jgi:hypothetical protein
LKGCRFFQLPEISLCFLAFFLNFFWEVIHTYFYEFKESAFSTLLYGWLHCTLGDVMITVGAFWLVSLINRNRRWFLSSNRINFVGFIMAGVGYTVFSEQMNVHLFRSWAYTGSMPTIPLTEIGLTPILQWIIIPSFTVLIVRHYHFLVRKAARKD